MKLAEGLFNQDLSGYYKGDDLMDSVKVKKTDLLDIIRDNRSKHKTVVEEAVTKYREEAIKQLDEMIAEAKAGKRIRRGITLIEPMDQTREYDSAIKMLEMSVDEEITLDSHSFRTLVLDQWQWKNQFSTSNFAYVSSDIGKSILGEP